MNNTINILEMINRDSKKKNLVILILFILVVGLLFLAGYLYFFHERKVEIKEVIKEKECEVTEERNEEPPVIEETDDEIVKELSTIFTDISLYHYSSFLGLDDLKVTSSNIDDRAKLLIAFNEVKDYYLEEMDCDNFKNDGKDGDYICGNGKRTKVISEEYLLGVIKRYFGNDKMKGINFNTSFGARFKYEATKKLYFYQEQKLDTEETMWKPSPRLVDYDYKDNKLEIVMYFDIKKSESNKKIVYGHDDKGYDYHFVFKKNSDGLYVFESLEKVKNE